MKRHVPNVLTLSRLVMAVAIFALLAFYQADSTGRPAAPSGQALLDAALAVFLLAMATDVLDGYLARRFNSPTTFGRISDPFVDKVLICGAFAYFAGANFTGRDAAGHAASTTGVATWMAVLIFTREIFVTGVRGFSESRGEPFTTTVFGKAKMFLQSLTVVWILVSLGRGREWGPWLFAARDALVWLTVIFTVASALVYFDRVRRLMGLPPTDAGGGRRATP
jgi:CDP-diacylglycerol--glycerol-3-phosphate 3-phosphatidyltransferase